MNPKRSKVKVKASSNKEKATKTLRVTPELMKDFKGRVPVKVTNDCLFNCLSMALSGSEDLALEIKLGTACEFVQKRDQIEVEAIAKGFAKPSYDFFKEAERVAESHVSCTCNSYGILAAAKALKCTINVWHFPFNDSEAGMHVCIYDPVHQVPAENQLKIMWRVSQGRHIFNPLLSKPEQEAEPKAEPDAEQEAEPEDELTKEIERIQISTPEDSFGKQLKITKLQKLRRIQKKRKF